MPSKYSVVEYLPDPMSGEKINVGVLAWDDNGVKMKFLSNWSRTRAFGGEDVGFILQFSRELEAKFAKDGSSLLATGGLFDVKGMEELIGSWSNSLQFSAPRGSLDDVESLVRYASHTFLQDSPSRLRQGRTRSTAIKIAHQIIRDAVEKKLPDQADALVHRKEALKGHLVAHNFDVVLKNGSAVAAVNALSFEVKTLDNAPRDIDAIAWALDDVRRQQPDLPLGVYLLSGDGSEAKGLTSQATRLFHGLNAKVFNNDAQLSDWAAKQVDAYKSAHDIVMA